VEILAQSSAAFALTQAYNFQGTHILGASRGHLSDSVISLSNNNNNNVENVGCFTELRFE